MTDVTIKRKMMVNQLPEKRKRPLSWNEQQGSNVFGIKNAPAGFSVWAKNNGAVEIENDQLAPDH